MSTKNIKLKTNSNRKNKFRVRVTREGAHLIKLGKMPLTALAGLFGGVAGAKGFDVINDRLAERDDSTDNENVEDAAIEDDSNGLCDYEVPTSVEFADKVTDDMSFGEAFETAREELGQGGFFTWKGKHYNTYNKEEWDSFSEEDKKEFFQLFVENTDFENGSIKEIEPNHEIIKPSDIDQEFVELKELGSEEEIIEGLNDGEAFEEEENFGEDIF